MYLLPREAISVSAKAARCSPQIPAIELKALTWHISHLHHLHLRLTLFDSMRGFIGIHSQSAIALIFEQELAKFFARSKRNSHTTYTVCPQKIRDCRTSERGMQNAELII